MIVEIVHVYVENSQFVTYTLVLFSEFDGCEINQNEGV